MQNATAYNNIVENNFVKYFTVYHGRKCGSLKSELENGVPQNQQCHLCIITGEAITTFGGIN